jgi:outer membrane protein assembly factor BamB
MMGYWHLQRQRTRAVSTFRFFGLVLVSVLPVCTAARADDWPQWMGARRDGVWRETGILDKFPRGGPKVRWRAPVGMGYSGPAVADGKVYLTDRVLDRDVQNPASGFTRKTLAGKERVLCLRVSDGKEVWTHAYPCTYEVSYPAGPRTTPVVSGGKVYTLGTMGDLLCLDAARGKEVWSKKLTDVYSTSVPRWGFSSSPLVVGDKLICLVGGEGSGVVAFHKDTGKEIWKALTAVGDDGLGYCPPVLIRAGGRSQLIVWLPQVLASLDPDSGKVYWTEKSNARAGMTIPMPRQEGDRLLVSCFYNGSMMLKLATDRPAAEVLWMGKHFLRPRPGSEEPQNTDGLHCVMSTPVFKGDYIYGIDSYGQLRCVEAATGKRLWQDLRATGGELERWGNAFIVAQGDRYFLFNELGDLIIAKMSPKGYQKIDRAHVLDPTNRMAAGGFSRRPNRKVLWSHPAFADRAMLARNDKEFVCVSLAAK